MNINVNSNGQVYLALDVHSCILLNLIDKIKNN